MAQRSCCRSCQHCLPPEGGQQGWCQLRRLDIHPDLIGELWCHHWTARPPRLPEIGPTAAPRATPQHNRQLSLGTVLQQHF